MKRELLTIRINPAYIRWIKKQASNLCRSDGYIVEHTIYQMAKNDPEIASETPGRKLDDD